MLCLFLGRDVPEEPFPDSNSRGRDRTPACLRRLKWRVRGRRDGCGGDRSGPTDVRRAAHVRPPDDLERSLESLAARPDALDELVVVDNDCHGVGGDRRALPRPARPHLVRVVGDEPGRGGGTVAGAAEMMRRAGDDDWIGFLDDDDPVPVPDLVHRPGPQRRSHAARRPERRRRRAARRPARPVEPAGSCRSRRRHDAVDHLHGNPVPCYRVGALRQVGPFDAELFFGFEELELGLRLRREGSTLTPTPTSTPRSAPPWRAPNRGRRRARASTLRRCGATTRCATDWSCWGAAAVPAGRGVGGGRRRAEAGRVAAGPAGRRVGQPAAEPHRDRRCAHGRLGPRTWTGSRVSRP